MNPHILILAAGQGKRMQSNLPKVLHPVLYRPMLHYVIDTAKALSHESIHVVVGHGENEVRAACAHDFNVKFISQPVPKGTADAVKKAESILKKGSGHLLVLSGDVMLLKPSTLEALLKSHESSGALATVLTAKLDNPYGYGRVIRGKDDEVEKIVEQADCRPEEAAVCEVNSGVYVFAIAPLWEVLCEIQSHNQQGEYYLTDAIEKLTRRGKVAASALKDPSEMTGINDRAALAEVECLLQQRINREWMLRGVSLQNPGTIYIDPTSQLGRDVRIEAGSVIVASEIGDGVIIEAGCRLIRTKVKSGSHIKQGSYLQESEVGEFASVGPYAHLRPGSRLATRVKIGNFVEIKKSSFGEGSKASHLSYIGDADVGAGVNLGCGFITCNYDGVNKHKTVIGDGVFVGSDTQVVAPITLDAGCYVAAGSTLTRDVPKDALALSRGKQVNKEGYARHFRAKPKS